MSEIRRGRTRCYRTGRDLAEWREDRTTITEAIERYRHVSVDTFVEADAFFASLAEQTHDELHEAIHNTCTRPIHEGER